MGDNEMPYLKLTTWQTTTKDNKGYKKAVIDSTFKHENVGHAAVTLVLPVNDETTKLVDEICEANNIPYYVVNHAVSTADLQYSNEDVKISDRKENVSSQTEYHIYFSFWPAAESDVEDKNAPKYSLNTPDEDYKSERDGRTFWKEGRRRDLIESSRIKVQEVMDDKNERVKRVFLLSPQISIKRDTNTFNEKALEIGALKIGLADFHSNLMRIISQAQNQNNVADSMPFLEMPDFTFIDQLDSFFPDLGIRNKLDLSVLHSLYDDKGRITNQATFMEEAIKVAENVTQIMKLITQASRSVPYHERIYNDSQEGDLGDDEIIIPVSFISQGQLATPADQEALDARKMLERMAEIVKAGKKWEMHRYNCSSAAEDVIVSGIQKPEQLREFKSVKTRGLPQTPQIARRRTLALASEIQSKWQGAKKNQPKKSDSFSASIQMIVKTLEKDIRKNTQEINKSDIVSEKGIDTTLTADNLIALTDEIKRIRNEEGKIPVISVQLTKEINDLKNKYQALTSMNPKKVKKESLNEARNFLSAYKALEMENMNLFHEINKRQRGLRVDEYKKREVNHQFLDLIQQYKQKPNKANLKEIKIMMKENRRLLKTKVDGVSLATFAKENGLKSLEKYLHEKEDKIRMKPLVISVNISSTIDRKSKDKIQSKHQHEAKEKEQVKIEKPVNPLSQAQSNLKPIQRAQTFKPRRPGGGSQGE
jgi:hypothetical protein